MSKGVKKVASIALPIVGGVVGGPIGAAVGGAIGGSLSGGGLTGAALGAVTGYASTGIADGIVGHPAGTDLATVTGQAGMQGPTLGTGIKGALTGNGIRAFAPTMTSSAIPSSLLALGNQAATVDAADTAEKAARIQAGSIDKALLEQRPYTAQGKAALAEISRINKDPSGYVLNDPLYTSLAADAERRLTANQAARGKVASGGTASALQDQLLQLGSGLLQNRVNTLQGQVNSGQAAATNASNLITGKGDVTASGTIGAQNAYTKGYENQINTILALRNLSTAPSYAPTQTIYG